MKKLGRKRKTKAVGNFSLFCLVLFYFFFSIMPIFEIVSKKKAVFRKEKKLLQKQSTLSSRIFLVFVFVGFIRGILPALEG